MVFPRGRVVLDTALMASSLPEALVKTLAKNLVKNLTKHLIENPENVVRKFDRKLSEKHVKHLQRIFLKLLLALVNFWQDF